MKTKILKNPEKVAIEDYPIEEAIIDESGNAVMDRSTGTHKGTGTTLEWSLGPGEALSFPKYVADYLLKIYPFLEVVDALPEEEKPLEDKIEPPAEVVEKVVPKAEKVVFEDVSTEATIPEEKEEKKEETEEKKEKKPKFYCDICEQQFKGGNTYGMHVGAKHPERLP